MKAIVFENVGGPDVLTLAEVPRPDVRPGMVLIRNHAIGVNFADTRFRQGTYVVKPKLPDTPGLEAAGVIEAVGDGVTSLRPGTRVAAFASKSYAEYCLAPAPMVIPLPEFVSFTDGADAVINYAKEKFADETLRLTDGRGVDLILDAVGKPTFEEGLRCLAPFGHPILYGRAGGPTDPLNVATLSPKSIKVSGFMLPAVTRGFPDKTRESAERCFGLMREGRLKLHIGQTFPLAQAAEAHRHLESRQSMGKLILVP